MIIKSGYEIWKSINEVHPQKLENVVGFNSESKFLLLDDVQNELKEHLEYYKGTKIENFINSFLHGLEIE